MTEALDIFKSVHGQLEADYVLEDDSLIREGRMYSLNLEIAILIASRLREDDGGKPDIFWVTGTPDDQTRFKPLWPVPYDYQVRWNRHAVCIKDGIVYDPILETPVPIENYPMEAFGTDVLIGKSPEGVGTLYPAEQDTVD